MRMKNKNIIMLIGILFLMCFAIPVYSANRLALVIGNSEYQGYDFDLKNPRNDAKDMAGILSNLGFDVELKLDATKREMIQAINTYKKKLKALNNGVGLFYYAGHGVQSNGRNYLIPSGAIPYIIEETDLEFEAVDLHSIVNPSKRDNNLNIVILDACRDNPFRSIFRGRGRNNRGLALPSIARGSFIAYATAPGRVALDGIGNNSPYTLALKKFIAQPNITIEKVFKLVGREVEQNTQGKQIPWYSSSLFDDFFFNPNGSVPSPISPSISQLQKIKYREMINVGGGTFQQPHYIGYYNFEHTISDFMMGKYEVTYELWHFVKNWGEKKGYVFANPGREGSRGSNGKKPSNKKYEPVVKINWRDAIVWCNAYSEINSKNALFFHDGSMTQIIKKSTNGPVDTTKGSCDNPYVDWNADGYRLPTLGEWQYAASYIDGNNWTHWRFASGATEDNDYQNMQNAVYQKNSNNKTATVGSKNKNRLGIHDMSGNVWEFCWDWLDASPITSAQKDYKGVLVPNTYFDRVVKGGSYSDQSYKLSIGSSSGRALSPGDSGYSDVGFRIVSK